MRQIMPHRNNIAMHRTKCKMFFNRGGRKTPIRGLAPCLRTQRGARFLSAGFDIVIQNNAL
jgi:hypothetical protein